MSTQSEAKKAQNYDDKPMSRRCRSCRHVKKKIIEKRRWGADIDKLSCGIGGFAVKANAICDRFEKAE